jgi:hypothetical protein
MAELIDSTDPQWESLYKIWLSEKKPGYVVTAGGASYRVFEPDDQNIKFQLMEGIDSNYNSRSTSGFVK